MPFDAFADAYRLSFWNGVPVKSFKTPVEALRDALPDFELRPFGTPPHDNPRMRMIVRMPHGEDQNERPVAAVSDKYDLLQHRVVASWLQKTIAETGLKHAKAKVLMSEFGERMRITIPLSDPGVLFDDPDFFGRDAKDEVYQPQIELVGREEP